MCAIGVNDMRNPLRPVLRSLPFLPEVRRHAMPGPILARARALLMAVHLQCPVVPRRTAAHAHTAASGLGWLRQLLPAARLMLAGGAAAQAPAAS